MRHIISYSGGIGSFSAAMRVADQYGTENMVLLFADTKIEDDDLYRFLDETAAHIGIPLTIIAEGRDPWQVMNDVRYIANSRVDPCSKILKRDFLNKWRDKNCTTDDVFYIGIDWSEVHRLERLQARVAPWTYKAPMCDAPYLSKSEMIAALPAHIAPPRLYSLGFPHNNCGGFCVKAGQAQFALLLRTFPERYLLHEEAEEKLREKIGDHSIMKDRRGGTPAPLTMRDFRKRIQRQGDLFDPDEWGGCGCAVD